MSQILETGAISGIDLQDDLQKALQVCIATYPKAKLRAGQLLGGRSEQQKGSVENIKLVLEWLGMESEACRNVLDERGLLKENAPAFDSSESSFESPSASNPSKKVKFDLRHKDNHPGNISGGRKSLTVVHQPSEDTKAPQPSLSVYDILASTGYSKQRIDELISRFNRPAIPVMDDQTFCNLVKQLTSTHDPTNVETHLKKRLLKEAEGVRNEHSVRLEKEITSNLKRKRMAEESEISGKPQVDGCNIVKDKSLKGKKRL